MEPVPIKIPASFLFLGQERKVPLQKAKERVLHSSFNTRHSQDRQSDEEPSDGKSQDEFLIALWATTSTTEAPSLGRKKNPWGEGFLGCGGGGLLFYNCPKPVWLLDVLVEGLGKLRSTRVNVPHFKKNTPSPTILKPLFTVIMQLV